MLDSALVGQDELTAALSHYLSAQAGKSVEVTGLTRMSNGWESDVYAFDAPLWLARRWARPASLFWRKCGADCLARISLVGFAAARWLSCAAGGFGRAIHSSAWTFVSDHGTGRRCAVGQVVARPDPAVRQREMVRFCELLATLHTLAWQHLPGAEHVPSFTIEQQLAVWSAYEAIYPLEG